MFQNNTDQAEIFFGADMPVSSTVEVFDSAHDDIIGEEITDDADDETPSVNQNNAVSIKTEAAEDDVRISLLAELLQFGT